MAHFIRSQGGLTIINVDNVKQFSVHKNMLVSLPADGSEYEIIAAFDTQEIADESLDVLWSILVQPDFTHLDCKGISREGIPIPVEGDDD